MFTEESRTDEGVELLWAYFRMTWAWNPGSHYADGGAGQPGGRDDRSVCRW